MVEDMGAEIIGFYAINKAAIEGVKDGFDGNTMPIVIKANDNKLLSKLELDLKLINKNVFIIETEKEMDEKEVKKILTDLKKTISKK